MIKYVYLILIIRIIVLLIDDKRLMDVCIVQLLNCICELYQKSYILIMLLKYYQIIICVDDYTVHAIVLCTFY